MRLLLLSFLSFAAPSLRAQVDTLNTGNAKLNTAALKEGPASYAVYFADSTGKRTSSADIWDRTVAFSTDAAGRKTYTFRWEWWHRDSLQRTVIATGELPSLRPLTHLSQDARRGDRAFAFTGGVVRVAEGYRRTAKDSAFAVTVNPPGFEFPMDLEILPLLPVKKVGQQFALAFYEPGSPQSNYYKLTVTGKEDLLLPGGQGINCWLLRLDYGPGVFATFWISDKTRETLKMKEEYKGAIRFKVRLY